MDIERPGRICDHARGAELGGIVRGRRCERQLHGRARAARGAGAGGAVILHYMRDASIIIYTVRNRPKVPRPHPGAHKGEMYASSATASELRYGAHKSHAIRQNPDTIEGLPGRLELRDFDFYTADHAGQICPQLGPIEARSVHSISQSRVTSARRACAALRTVNANSSTVARRVSRIERCDA